jgi:hypothetical protein
MGARLPRRKRRAAAEAELRDAGDELIRFAIEREVEREKRAKAEQREVIVGLTESIFRATGGESQERPAKEGGETTEAPVDGHPEDEPVVKEKRLTLAQKREQFNAECEKLFADSNAMLITAATTTTTGSTDADAPPTVLTPPTDPPSSHPPEAQSLASTVADARAALVQNRQHTRSPSLHPSTGKDPPLLAFLPTVQSYLAGLLPSLSSTAAAPYQHSVFSPFSAAVVLLLQLDIRRLLAALRTVRLPPAPTYTPSPLALPQLLDSKTCTDDGLRMAEEDWASQRVRFELTTPIVDSPPEVATPPPDADDPVARLQAEIARLEKQLAARQAEKQKAEEQMRALTELQPKEREAAAARLEALQRERDALAAELPTEEDLAADAAAAAEKQKLLDEIKQQEEKNRQKQASVCLCVSILSSHYPLFLLVLLRSSKQQALCGCLRSPIP